MNNDVQGSKVARRIAPSAAALACAVAMFGAGGARAAGLSQVSIDDVSIAEGNSGTTHLIFHVTLDTPAVGDVTLHVDTVDGEATAGSDYTGITDAPLTILDGASSGTVDVSISTDTVDEDDEGFFVVLSNPSANAVLLDDTGAGTINNDDAANAPTVSINNASVTEAETNLSFTVTLSKNAGRNIDVDVNTSDGTAVAPGDYSALSTTVHFLAGDRNRTVNVAVHDDALDEANETFTATLSNAVHATITGGAGTGTINDDGDASPVISVSPQPFSEGVGTANIEVDLDRLSGRTVTVRLDTQVIAGSGNASAADFGDIAATTMTFAPGTLTQTIPVTIVEDNIDEDDEPFRAHLSTASNGTIDPGKTDANITIVDNDGPPELSASGGSTTENNAGGTVDDVDFTLTLDHPSAFPITVTVNTRDGTAQGSDTNGADYDNVTNVTVTFAAGDLSQVVAVDTNDDNVNEATEDFFLDVTNPTAGRATLASVASCPVVGSTCAEGIIFDDDPPPAFSIANTSGLEGTGAGSTNLTFTVSLAGATDQDVAVDFATSGGTATSDVDFTSTSGTLAFPAGTVTRTIVVPINRDALDENDETFTVTLSNPLIATIADGSGTGTINDDDNAPTISVGAASVLEGNAGTTTLSFPITLSAPSGKNISVTAATSDGTARQPGDYTARTASVAIAAGASSGNFDVVVKGDVTFEADETVVVTLSGATNATIGTASANGTIQNDDTIPTISIADASLDPEGNSGARNMGFTVTLSNPTDQLVAFNFGTTDITATAGQDYVGVPTASSTIAAGSLSTVVNVVVAGDTLNEPNETFRVTLSSPTNALLAQATATGTIVDDDPLPTVSVVQPVAAATEGDVATSVLHFTVVLSTATGQSVTVHAQTQDDTAVANPGGPVGDDDYVAVPDTLLTFAPGATVLPFDVTVKPDTLDEADQEQFKVVLTTPTNAAIGNATGLGKINDDDATPTLRVNDVVINPEGNIGTQDALFTVTLSAVSGRDVLVDFTTADATAPAVTATAGTDYIAQSGTLTIPRGSTTATVTVLVEGDLAQEADEHFSLVLSNPRAATIADGTGDCRITNDDSGPTTNTLDHQLDTFANGAPYEVAEEGTLTVSAADGVLRNDVDADGNTLHARLAAPIDPAQGVMSVNDNGSFTFTGALDFFGQVRFQYIASDGTNDSAPQDVFITVDNVNDAPVLDTSAFVVHQTEDDPDPSGALVSDLVTARITDADPIDAVGIAIIGLPPSANGSVEISLDNGAHWTAVAANAASDANATLVPHTGRVRIVPPLDGNGSSDIVIRAWDGHGTAGGTSATSFGPSAFFSTAQGTLRLVVDAVNDAPVFVAPTPTAPVPALEGTAVLVTLAAIDVDDAQDALVFALDANASVLPASASFNASAHTLSFLPLLADAGTYHAHFTVTDAAGAADARDVEIDVLFIDADADGLPDTWEVSVGLDPTKKDSDGDGIADKDEVGDIGALTAPGQPVDTDGDGVPDALDLDSDDDGVPDADEAGDTDLATPPLDSDGDGVPDFQETDSDKDTILDGDDNCRGVPNTDQADLDGDNIGDACDDDVDGDRLIDVFEAGLGLDPRNPDTDGDGILDGDEVGDPLHPADSDGDGVIDALSLDSDGDGVPDSVEAGDSILGTKPVDTDGDGVPDFQDTDSDGDNVPDDHDNCRITANTDQTDLDGDGIGDACHQVCGDHAVQEPEECDPDPATDPVAAAHCSPTCTRICDKVDTCNGFDDDCDGKIDVVVTKGGGEHSACATRDITVTGGGLASSCGCSSGVDGVPFAFGAALALFLGLRRRTSRRLRITARMSGGVDEAHVGGAHVGGAHVGGAHVGGAHAGGAHVDGGHGAPPRHSARATPRDVEAGTTHLDWANVDAMHGAPPRHSARATSRKFEAATALALLLATSARASDGIGVNQFTPATGGSDDIVGVEGTVVNGSLMPTAGLYLDYAYKTLDVSDKSTHASVSLLEHRLDADVVASLSLFQRASVGLSIPVTIFQAAGHDDVFVPATLSPVALGDVRVDGRFTIFGDDRRSGGPALGVAAAVTAPTGNPADLEGAGFLTVEPRVIAGWRFGQRGRALVNVGYLLRPHQELLGFTVGNELTYGVGGAFTAIPILDVLGELSGRVAADPGIPVQGSTTPLEAFAGVRWHILPGHDVTAGAALGITSGYGTPLFRVLAGYTFTLLAPEDAKPIVTAVADRDHDGIPDDVDKCPDIPEDKDGIQDDDGCPEVDADGDGVPDNIDQCPEVPENKNGFEDEDGCPEYDRDGDGINDDKDKCPNEPEDRDGFQDDDGCPDPDNDGDGIKDVDDKCPNQAGPAPDGCPPAAAGTAAPLVVAPLVLIELPQRIYFQSNGVDVTSEGRRLLVQVAESLKHNTEVRVEVQGHSDDVGSGDQNDSLSLRRANAVINILVAAGVPRQRFLIAVLSDHEPLAPNDTPQGRALNRRVQFRVLPP